MNHDEMFVDPGEFGVKSTATRYARIPLWVLLSTEVSSTDKVLYAYLMSRADNLTHVTYPVARRRMAADLDVSVRTIARSLSALVDAKMLVVEQQKRISSDGTPWYDWSVYTVIFDKPAEG
jgi:hypothetical protein